MRVVGVVPLKLNNERLPGKNLISMADGKPLVLHILEALAASATVDETYVFCSDGSVEPLVSESGATFLQRSQTLDQPTTKSNDILGAFIREVPADVYVLAHATSPFLTPESIDAGVASVRAGRHDSAFAAVRVQEFLWAHGKAINFDPADTPRTQDLDPLFAETSGYYAFTREVFLRTGRRVGLNPLIIEVSKIEAIDIDTADDFSIANAVMTEFVAGRRRQREQSQDEN